MVINHMYVDAVCFPVRKNPGKRNEGNDIVKQIAMHSWLYCITYLGRYGQVSSRRVLCCTMLKRHAFLYRALTFCRMRLGFFELHSCPRLKKKQPWAIHVKCKRSRLCSTNTSMNSFVVFRNILSILARSKAILEEQAY